MDVHVPRAVTTALRLRSIDVLTAQEDGAAQLDDDQLLQRATVLGRVLVSQDADLLREATRRLRDGQEILRSDLHASTSSHDRTDRGGPRSHRHRDVRKRVVRKDRVIADRMTTSPTDWFRAWRNRDPPPRY